MFQDFFRMADKSVDEETIKRNAYVETFKADTVDRVNPLLAKIPACKKAWAARNSFLAEVNAHIYPHGLGHAAQYIERLELMHDPLSVVNAGKEEWENVSYYDLCDGTGMDRWPLDPTRVDGKRSSILSKLNAVNITNQILRDIDAAKDWLEADAKLIADGHPPEPPPIPAAPAKVKDRKVVVESKYKTLN